MPWMRLEQGVRLREFILDHGIRDFLELGFYRGVSACDMAAALAEAGGGSITTMDKEIRVEGNWAFARKRRGAEGAALTAVRRETEVRLVPVPGGCARNACANRGGLGTRARGRTT